MKNRLMILSVLLLPMLASATELKLIYSKEECQTVPRETVRQGYQAFRGWHAEQKKAHQRIASKIMKVLVRRKKSILKALQGDADDRAALREKLFQPIVDGLNKQPFCEPGEKLLYVKDDAGKPVAACQVFEEGATYVSVPSYSFDLEDESLPGTLDLYIVDSTRAPLFPLPFFGNNDVSVFLSVLDTTTSTEIFSSVMDVDTEAPSIVPRDQIVEQWVTAGFSEILPKKLSEEDLSRITAEIFDFEAFNAAHPECK